MKNNECRDLIVLGLPYKTNEEELKMYFSQFGELTVAIVKQFLNIFYSLYLVKKCVFY